MKQRQVRFLEALLKEPTMARAAHVAGITRSTAYSYLKDPTFKAELESRSNACIDDAARYLQSKLTFCAESLMKIIENEDTAPQVKVNAINTAFYCCKSMTESDVVLRVQRLERLSEGSID